MAQAKKAFNMPIVKARIERMNDNPEFKTRAIANVVIGGQFVVHGIRVMDSQKGLFVQMPQRSYVQDGKTNYTDIFHAISAESRNLLIDTVLKAYEEELENQESEDEDDEFSEEPDEDDLPFSQTM